MQCSKYRLLPLTFAILTALSVTSYSNDDDDNDEDTTTTTSVKTLSSIDFTETPLPSSNADMVRNYTTSKAILTYSDGSKAEFPLSYNTLFTTTDRVGKNAN